MAGRTTPFPRSLTRPVLFAGAERKPVAVVGMLGFMLCFLGWMSFSVLPAVIGAAVLFIGIPTLRALAKRDPYMFACYRRHLAYRHYHRAYSTPFRTG
jgi:type IV secretion system protein VirB3